LAAFPPGESIGVSNLKDSIYRNFQFAKGKYRDYILGILAFEGYWMSAFLGFT